MRKIFYLALVIVLLAGFTSCTMEKRHYRNGYYFDRNARGSHVDPLDHEENASVEVVTATKDSVTRTTVAANSAVSDSVKIASQESQTQLEQKRETVAEQIFSKLPKKMQPAPVLIEKDKKQATGAGIAAAVFFIIGMLGLIIKGTSAPYGIFIAAAFVCFLLCVILASFLYPRDPVVEQSKEESTQEKRTLTAAASGVIALIVLGGVLAAGIAILIFTSLFGWLF